MEDIPNLGVSSKSTPPLSNLSFTKLKTLDEVDEYSNSEQKPVVQKSTMNLIIDSTRNIVESFLTISPDRKSNSSSRTKLNKSKRPGSKLGRKKLHDSSLTSITSFTPQSFTDDYQYMTESIPKTPLPLIPIDYEKLLPNKCGDLTKLNYANDLEKYLIIRIYSDVNKLSTILAELDQVNLEYYLNTPDQNDCLPLYYAIKAECTNAVRLLLNKGSSLDKTTKTGDPALHLACLLGASIELIEFILSYDANIDLYSNDQEGWTVLHCACNQGHLEIVKYLLEKKHMNPNIKDSHSNYTGLQLAAINDRVEVVEYFLTFTSLASIKIKTETDTELKEKKENQENKIVNNVSKEEIVNIKNILIDTEDSKSKSSKSNSKSDSFETITVEKLKLKSSKKAKKNSDKSSILSEPKENQKEKKIVKKCERITLEPFVYIAENKFYKEPLSVYKNFYIDLNSLNSDGQNVMHLVCKFGKYDIVNLLLKRYGSNQIDLNKMDFKDKTCLDLAWEWILSLNLEVEDPINQNIDSEGYHRNISLFYDYQNAFYVQRKGLINDNRIDTEIKLIYLLYKYGAKFSDVKQLLFDVDSLKESDPNEELGLPSNLFYPEDHVSFIKLKLQSRNLISIQTYLKSILYILKLNMPTMFLSTKKPRNSFSSDYCDSESFDSNLETCHSFGQKNFKKLFHENFQSLLQFIQQNVVDSFEKQFYFHNIQNALKLLSKY